MKKLLLVPMVAIALTSLGASAASINLRHEFIPEEGDMASRHRDRMTLAHTFENGIGISGEMKWGYAGDDVNFGEIKSVGHEAKVSYNYKATDSFTLQPAYALDSNDSAVTHKLDLKGTQKLTDEWNVALRYRYGYKNVSAPSTDNSHYNQLNLTSGYNIGNFGLGIDFEYKFEQSDSSGYDGDNNYLNLVNLTAEYKGFESGWRPFIEFGMVAQNTDVNDAGKDEYVARYRAGLKYNF